METGKRLMFIVALIEHRHFGVMFMPYLIEPLKSYFSVRSAVRIEEVEQLEFPFTDVEKEIVRLAGKCSDYRLATKFSRNKNSTEFYNEVTPEYLQQNVIPYVEKQMYSITKLLMNNPIPVFERDINYSNLYDEDRVVISDTFTKVRFRFDKSGHGTDYKVELFHKGESVRIRNRKVRFIVNDPCVMQVDSRILVLDAVDSKKILPFLSRDHISVPLAIEPKYYRNFVLGLVRDHEVEANGFKIVDDFGESKAVLTLEKDLQQQPVFVLRFSYGHTVLTYNDKRKLVVILDENNGEYTFYRYHRRPEWENALVDALCNAGLIKDQGLFYLPGERLIENSTTIYSYVEWLSANENLLRTWMIKVDQRMEGIIYFTGKVNVSFDIQSNNDWFDLHSYVTIGTFKFPFLKLRKHILNNLREFELPNGEIAILPNEWFEKYKLIFHFGKVNGERLQFGRQFYNVLSSQINSPLPSILSDIVKSFEQVSAVDLPEGLRVKLRPYQKEGFQWMYTLMKNGMGGCLADDMGLGKTLQTLALLLKIRKERKKVISPNADKGKQLDLFDNSREIYDQPASLIVVPTSLVHNWINEISRFAPTLKVHVHIGPNRNKKNDLDAFVLTYDIIITTYGTLRIDRELFSSIQFYMVILDESQYIKNRSSKIYETVMSMKPGHRMVLTGTPIENSLADLWTQMNFLNKGLLGSYPFFRANFQQPIESKSEEKVEEKLQLLIRPFILRRTKSEVASDLPPLMEQVRYCSMTPEQQSVYEKEKSKIRNTIISSIEQGGVNGSSIVILQGLTRLRQLANHPTLVNSEDEAGSGKFNEIVLSLEALVAEKHKVLVFSSFVSHLEILKNHMDKENWKYSLLTGKTINREEVIKKFQEDSETSVFLISLKAGGVGLNLTQADYVFIVDPWWNPAAELQAISRAHRIGQDKHVFVYRFITENTIEEKIQTLKDRKSGLADKFINSNNPFSEITSEEIMSLLE
ncbi:protein containing helicase conserved C-terminal domain [Bacteroidales bacterium 6E]|nr:protein containing helicase conserved C-terminal domain [Bacteroidales bacterium 6E]